jgi:hypothetical protein
MPDYDRSSINMSSIPVAGIGGLGMVAAAGVVAYTLPEARALILVGAAGGVLTACALIAYRRLSPSDPGSRPTLMVESAAERAVTADRRRADSELRLAPSLAR